jgi:hypothetical protein
MDSTTPVDSKRHWGVNIATWAAIFILLHPLSVGPLIYMEARGWINTTPFQPVFNVVYAPEIHLINDGVSFPNSPSRKYLEYVMWWQGLGEAHAAAVPTATPVAAPAPAPAPAP